MPIEAIPLTWTQLLTPTIQILFVWTETLLPESERASSLDPSQFSQPQPTLSKELGLNFLSIQFPWVWLLNIRIKISQSEPPVPPPALASASHHPLRKRLQKILANAGPPVWRHQTLHPLCPCSRRSMNWCSGTSCVHIFIYLYMLLTNA